MVDREDHGMVAPPRRTSPIVRPPTRHYGRAHANPGTSGNRCTNDHPALPDTPSTFETSFDHSCPQLLPGPDGRGTQTHCLPCYPGSPPVRRHRRGRGTHTGHTCCTHMNDQDRTKGTSRWLHRSPGTVWNLPSGPLPVVPPCSVPTLIPVLTPRRLWAHPSLYSASPLGVLGM
jgi:hypothetical protein